MSVFRREFLKWIVAQGEKAEATFWQLANGKLSGSPFADVLEGARCAMDRELRRLGEKPERRVGDRGSEINFRRLLAVAKSMDDEDF